METSNILAKVVVFLCMLTQLISAAGMIIFMQFLAQVTEAGFQLNLFILLIYGFITAVGITITDIYRPAFWSQNLSFLKYFWGRTVVYVPFGALVYFDQPTIPNYQYLKVSVCNNNI